MSRPLLKLEPLAGVKDLAALMEVLADQKKYRAIVDELEGLRKSLNVRIEAVGKVDQIDRLRSEAVQINREAKAALEAALGKIRSEREQFESEQRIACDRVDAAHAELDRELSELTQTLDDRERVVKEREKSAEALMAEGLTIKEEASDAKAAADNLRAEYDRKVTLIEDTMKRVSP